MRGCTNEGRRAAALVNVHDLWPRRREPAIRRSIREWLAWARDDYVAVPRGAAMMAYHRRLAEEANRPTGGGGGQQGGGRR